MSLLALLAHTHPTKPEETGVVDQEVYAPRMANISSTTRLLTGSQRGPYEETRDVQLNSDVEAFTIEYRRLTADLDGATVQATIDSTVVTWGGVDHATFSNGKTLASDPVQLPVSVGDIVQVTTSLSPGTEGGNVPSRVAWEGGTLPSNVKSLTSDPSVLMLGSSTSTRPGFNLGFSRANVAAANYSGSGGYASSLTEDTLDVLDIRLGHGFTHAFNQLGINDSMHGAQASARAMLALAQRLRARGIKHFTQMTWQPYTSSTDGWKTLEGQAVRGERDRTVEWLRRGAPCLVGGSDWDEFGNPGALLAGEEGHPFTMVCDAGAALEYPYDYRLYRVDLGPLTSDGLHVNDTGYELLAGPIQEWGEAIKAEWEANRPST